MANITQMMQHKAARAVGIPTSKVRDWAKIHATNPITPFWDEADDLLIGIKPTIEEVVKNKRIVNRGADFIVKYRGRMVLGAAAFAGIATAGWIAFGKRRDRQTQITGLADTGIAQHSRHGMTPFGTGWGGIDPGFTVEHQLMGVNKEYLAVLKKGEEEIGYMGYAIRPGGILEQGPMQMFQKGGGHGKALMAEIMKKAAKEHHTITFRSDPAGLSEEMVNFFKAGMKKGIFTEFEEGGKVAYKANLFNIEQVLNNVMKLGEGKAIVNAGASEIPAVLKATARVMKNAL